MRKIFFMVNILVFVFAANAWAEDISGTWDLKMYGPHGEEKMVLVIQVEGEDLSITGNHPSLGDVTGSGTLKGNLINMHTDPAGPKEIAMEFTGTVDGDKMSGTREHKMYGDGSIKVVHDSTGAATAVGRDEDVPSKMDPESETWSKSWTAERTE